MLRNLFKLSSLASFEGQLGKWSRMDDETHRRDTPRASSPPPAARPVRCRPGCGSGHDREALESAAKWQEIFGPDNYFLELMDHGLSTSSGGSVRACSRSAASSASRRWPPTTATTSPGTPRTTTRRCCACRPARRCRIPTGSSSTATATTSSRPRRCGDLWDDQVPGACDITLLIAERVQSYDDVWAPRDRMPIFPVPEGHDQATWLRHEVDGRTGSDGSRPGSARTTSTAPTSRSRSSATWASRRTSSSSPT